MWKKLVEVARLATRQPPVSTAPVGAARSRPLRRSRNIQRTAQLRSLREAKSLPYRACAILQPLKN